MVSRTSADGMSSKNWMTSCPGVVYSAEVPKMCIRSSGVRPAWRSRC